MKVIAVSSSLKGKKLEDALLDLDAIAVDQSCVESMEELKLAEHLTKKAFEQKRNIAKKRKYEFLLWLTGKTDLQSAFKTSRPKTQNIQLIMFSGDEKKIVSKLEARTRDARLKTYGTPQRSMVSRTRKVREHFENDESFSNPRETDSRSAHERNVVHEIHGTPFLRTRSDPLKLERISLSRIKN